MAPRRGGGGSWGGGGSVSCNGNAFSDESSKILISFAALFFVIYLILSFFVPGKKKRMAINGGQPLGSNGRWTALSWAISLQLMYVSHLVCLGLLMKKVATDALFA